MVKRWQGSDDEDDDFTPESNNIDSKLKQLTENKNTIEKSVAEAQAKYRESRNAVKSLEKEIADLEAKRQRGTSNMYELAQKQQQFAQAEEEKERNFEELEKVRAECGKVQEEIAKIRGRVVKLNNEIGEVQASNIKSAIDEKELKDKIAAVNKDIDDMQRRINEVKSQNQCSLM